MRLVLVIIGVLFGVPLPAAEKYALLVGVNKYKHADLNKPQPLEFAEADVLALKKVLEDSGYKVTLLQGDKATLDAIRTELAILRKNATGGKVVLVALAGHGLQPEDSKEAYFCPYTADQGVFDRNGKKVADWDTQTMLPLSEALAELKACGAEAKALLVDACRNDPKAGRGRGFGTGYNVGDLPENLALMLSCSKGERAWEHAKWGHGAFFHHVLKGLGEGKAALDGHITANSLSAYVNRAVKDEVPMVIGGGAAQKPHSIINGDVDLLIGPKAKAFRRVDLLAIWTRDAGVAREERYEFTADKVLHSIVGKYDHFPEFVDEGTYSLKDDMLTLTYTRRDGKASKERIETFAVKELSATKLQFLGADRTLVALENVVQGTKPRAGEERSVSLGEGMKMAFCWVPPSVGQPQGFWLSKYEVTQAEWKQVMQATPSFFASTGDGADQVKGLDTNRLPVERVSWDDTQGFLQRLNSTLLKEKPLGRGTFDLPTRAEWAYACQGGRKELPALTIGTANYENYYRRPLAVDDIMAAKQHPWGLCHMQGNIAEWCAEAVGTTKKRYVLGGHYEDNKSDCQATSVREVPADFASPTIGIRVKYQDSK